MNIYHQFERTREKMCAWDGYFFPARGRQEYCSGDCKNAARRERARADRDIQAAHNAWQTGELNNKELAEAINRAQFMPQSMRMEVERESEAQLKPRLMRWIRFKCGIIMVYIQIWIDQRREKHGTVGTPSSSGK